MSWSHANTYCTQQCGSTLSNGPSTVDGYDFVKLLSDHTFIVDSDTDIWTGFKYVAGSNHWEWPDTSLEPGWNSVETNCGKLSLNNNQYELIPEDCNILHRFLCDACFGQINKYILTEGPLNWTDSETFCNNYFDTSLASMHDTDDHDLGILLCQNTGNDDSCWIGLNDRDIEGTYIWRDGTQLDYGSNYTMLGTYPWGNNQPNNANGNEHCVNLWFDGLYSWYDNKCKETHSFICSKPSELCNNDNQWKYVNNYGSWTGLNQCALNGINDNTFGEYSHAILSDVQFTASRTIIIEFTFAIHKVFNTGGYVGLLLDVKSINDFIFVGINVEGDKDKLVTFMVNDNIQSGYLEQSFWIVPTFEAYWTLIASFDESSVTIRVNNVDGQLTSGINTTFKHIQEGCGKCGYSGYVGIGIHNISMLLQKHYMFQVLHIQNIKEELSEIMNTMDMSLEKMELNGVKLDTKKIECGYFVRYTSTIYEWRRNDNSNLCVISMYKYIVLFIQITSFEILQ